MILSLNKRLFLIFSITFNSNSSNYNNNSYNSHDPYGYGNQQVGASSGTGYNPYGGAAATPMSTGYNPNPYGGAAATPIPTGYSPYGGAAAAPMPNGYNPHHPYSTAPMPNGYNPYGGHGYNPYSPAYPYTPPQQPQQPTTIVINATGGNATGGSNNNQINATGGSNHNQNDVNAVSTNTNTNNNDSGSDRSNNDNNYDNNPSDNTSYDNNNSQPSVDQRIAGLETYTFPDDDRIYVKCTTLPGDLYPPYNVLTFATETTTNSSEDTNSTSGINKKNKYYAKGNTTSYGSETSTTKPIITDINKEPREKLKEKIYEVEITFFFSNWNSRDKTTYEQQIIVVKKHIDPYKIFNMVVSGSSVLCFVLVNGFERKITDGETTVQKGYRSIVFIITDTLSIICNFMYPNQSFYTGSLSKIIFWIINGLPLIGFAFPAQEMIESKRDAFFDENGEKNFAGILYSNQLLLSIIMSGLKITTAFIFCKKMEQAESIFKQEVSNVEKLELKKDKDNLFIPQKNVIMLLT